MNGAHLHLILNHAPVVGLAFATLALLYGVIVKDAGARRLALLVTFVAGLAAVPAFLTGEGAEDVVKSLPDVAKATIEEHEKAADFALAAGLVTAVVALGALALPKMTKRPTLAGKLFVATLVVTLWADSVLARTAYLGGQVRHTEIHGPG
jgi:hypothetical protein